MQKVLDMLLSAKEKFSNASFKVKLVIIVFTIGLLWFASSQIAAKNQTPQYQTAHAEKGTLVLSVTASGFITQGNNVSITTSATGVVQNVYVKNGDSVSQGQKIADISLDQNGAQKQAAAWASYLSAQNTLAAAKAKINSLQSTLFKTNQAFLKDKGTINPTTDDPDYIREKADWLQAEADYKNQSAVIAQAQASVTSAWLSYQQTSATITSSAKGVITNLTLAPGLLVTSTSTATTQTSQTVGTITPQDGSIQASATLSEIDATKVSVGQKATLTLDAFPGKTFTGKVIAIDTNGQVSSGVTTYPTTISIDTKEARIYPNMAITADIITSIRNNVLIVPSSAVQTQNNRSIVRVLRNGKAEDVMVETGDSSDTQTEIVSGLNEGDEVVTGNVSQNSSSNNKTGTSPFSNFRPGGLPAGGQGFGGGTRGR